MQQILNILKKKMIVMPIVFPKLKPIKELVRLMFKKARFKIPLEIQHVKGSEALLKYVWEQFCHSFSSFWGKLVSKISPLVICEISAAFVNTLTVDDKYPFRNCGNLRIPIQTQLYKKATISLFFVQFWKDISSFNHFGE